MMGSTSGLNRQLIATGHGDDQWMDWGPDGPPFLGRMTNPKSTPKSGRGYAGDIFGSEVVPFFVPNGVKLHVFSAREHQQAIISGDGVFPQIFELFPVLSLKIVFLLPQSYGSLCGPSLFLFKWPQPCG